MKRTLEKQHLPQALSIGSALAATMAVLFTPFMGLNLKSGERRRIFAKLVQQRGVRLYIDRRNHHIIPSGSKTSRKPHAATGNVLASLYS